MKYKAYVFDFDGVIKESVQVKGRAFEKLYEKYGEAFQNRIRKYHLEHGGISRYVKFRKWNEWLDLPTSEREIEKLAQSFANLVIKEVVDAPYVAGAAESVESLSRGNALSFIATGTPRAEMDRILENLGIKDSFNEVHGSEREKKVIVKDLLCRYDLSPSEVLFIGDAETDYMAATTHGLDFYFRRTDYNAGLTDGSRTMTFIEDDLCLLRTMIETNEK